MSLCMRNVWCRTPGASKSHQHECALKMLVEQHFVLESFKLFHIVVVMLRARAIVCLSLTSVQQGMQQGVQGEGTRPSRREAAVKRRIMKHYWLNAREILGRGEKMRKGRFPLLGKKKRSSEGRQVMNSSSPRCFVLTSDSHGQSVEAAIW